MKRFSLKLLVVAVVAFAFGAIVSLSTPAEADFPSDSRSTLVTTSVTCGVTATQFPSANTLAFAVRNTSGAAVAFIGGSDVTTGGGFPLYEKETASYSLANTNKLYCIVASGTQKLKITGESR